MKNLKKLAFLATTFGSATFLLAPPKRVPNAPKEPVEFKTTGNLTEPLAFACQSDCAFLTDATDQRSCQLGSEVWANAAFDGQTPVTIPTRVDEAVERAAESGALVFSPETILPMVRSGQLTLEQGDRMIDTSELPFVQTQSIVSNTFPSEVLLSPNGELLATVSTDNVIQIYNTESGELLRTFLTQQSNHIVLAWSGNGRLLASASCDKTIKIWSIETDQCLTTLTRRGTLVSCLAWAADEEKVACDSPDGAVEIWNTRTNQLLQILKKPPVFISPSVARLQWAPDGVNLAVSTTDGHLNVWNSETGQCLHNLRTDSGLVSKLVWSIDGELLASYSSNNTWQIWNCRTELCLQRLTEQEFSLAEDSWLLNNRKKAQFLFGSRIINILTRLTPLQWLRLKMGLRDLPRLAEPAQ